MPWRPKEKNAEKLYGAIVAQARLPVFYQEFGVPDTLEGRFVVLSLNLFAVLHRLKGEDAQAKPCRKTSPTASRTTWRPCSGSSASAISAFRKR